MTSTDYEIVRVDYEIRLIHAWFRRDLAVERDGSEVARIERARIRARAAFDVMGQRYTARIDAASGEFATLDGPTGRVATAERRSSGSNLPSGPTLLSGPTPHWRFTLETGGVFDLAASSKWSDDFRLTHRDAEIARIARSGSLLNRFALGCDADVPFQFALFAVFLYLETAG